MYRGYKMGLFSSLKDKFGAKEDKAGAELMSLQLSASRAIDEVEKVHSEHAAAIARECRALVLTYPRDQETSALNRYNNQKAAGDPQKMAAWLAYVTMKAARIGMDAQRRGWFATALWAIGVQKTVEDFFVAHGVAKWKENCTSPQFIQAHRDERAQTTRTGESPSEPGTAAATTPSAADVQGVVEVARAVTKAQQIVAAALEHISIDEIMKTDNSSMVATGFVGGVAMGCAQELKLGDAGVLVTVETAVASHVGKEIGSHFADNLARYMEDDIAKLGITAGRAAALLGPGEGERSATMLRTQLAKVAA